MNKHLFLFLLIFLLIPFRAHSQSNDAKLWSGLSIEKDFNKKFTGSMELEQRLNNNLSSFDKLLIEPAISYKFNKRWSIDLIYRLWYRKATDQNYIFHNRISLGLNYTKKIEGIKFNLVSKLQYGLPDRIEDDFYITKKLVSRNSIKLSYEIFGSRFTPFFKYELFTSLDRLRPQNYQWRSMGGTSIYLNSSINLRLYYAYEHEYNVVNRTNSNIWGISLQYSL